jgi:hypothetical protein
MLCLFVIHKGMLSTIFGLQHSDFILFSSKVILLLSQPPPLSQEPENPSKTAYLAIIDELFEVKKTKEKSVRCRWFYR